MPAPRQQPDRRSDGEGPPQFGKKKTVKMHPVMGIFLFVTPVVLLVVVITLWINRSAPQQEDTVVEQVELDDWYQNYKKKFSKAQKLFRDAMAVRNSEDQEEYSRRWQVANDFSLELQEELDKNLEDYMDEDGILLEDYGGYNADYSALNELRLDLVRTAPF